MFPSPRLKSILAATAVLLCCSARGAWAQLAPKTPADVIVKLRPGAAPLDRERALRNTAQPRPLGAGLQRQGARGLAAPETLALALKPGVPLSSELARLAENPAVEFVEPNYRTHILASPEPVIPNDFEFSNMYALANPGGPDAKTNADIHATAAWRFGTGSKQVIVAIIDTGIDYFHEDLRDNLWTNDKEIPSNGIDDDGNGLVDDYMGYDFVSGDSDPFDDNEHGTHVTGIIGARGNNGVGTSGVCWEVSLMALKAFDDQGSGTVEDAIEAMEYAVRQGARVINASWSVDEKSRALEEAVAKVSDAGVLFVAAAGNDRTDAPAYPASFETVLSVGATDKNDNRAAFSNYGPTVDIGAPGDSIYSTLPENRYGYLSGTSMAAPHVSGTAALVLSRFPNYSRQELFDILINSVDPMSFDLPLGNGRLDASRAIQMDQPLPTARLTVPAILSGEVVARGTAAGSFATGYSLSIGMGRAPRSWTQIASSTGKITNSPIATIDTSTVPDGAAVVQLVVTNQNGAVSVVNNPVKVLNTLISAPLSGDVIAPGKIQIRGTVYGAGKTFELFYGAGLNPSSWVKIPGEAAFNTVLEGKLGEWDASTLPNGPYALRIVSNAGTNTTEFVSPAIFLDSHLRPGWPVALPTDSDFPLAEWRNIRVADLDGDGPAEYVIVEPGTRQREQKLIVLEGDGSVRWTRALGFDVPPDVPAIGDIDHDGRSEIFVDTAEGIAAFHADGSMVEGWPLQVSTRNHAKVLADLNGDGWLELISFAQEYSATQVPDLRELAVYSSKGLLLRSWQLPWCGSTNDVQKIFPAVANIDDDPQVEIVAVSGCSEIAAFDVKHAEAKWRATGEGVFLSSPVIGDVDGDGRPDIVVAAAAENGSETGGIYIFRGDGQRWRGWPVLEEYSFLSAPALGDLDHDGRLEIVVPSLKPPALHVLQADGFEAEGWPIDAFHRGSPRVGISLADIDGDGASEILQPTPAFTSLALTSNDPEYAGGLIARRFNGEIVKFNPESAVPSLPFESLTSYRTHKASPPVAGDFDGDGRMDLALSSLQARTFGTNVKLKDSSRLYSWRLEAPAGAAALEWPMFAHDVQNAGAYTLPRVVVPPPTNVLAAIRDRILGSEDRELLIEPLANDYGAWPLQLAEFTLPEHGTVVRTNGTNILYVPDKDFTGFDQFGYTVRDARGATSTNQIIIRIKPVNDAPVAQDLHLTVKKNASVDVPYLAVDPENDRITFRVTDVPASGELWNYPTVGTYYPKRGFFGTDVFHYVASDGRSESAPATVTIEVVNSNNPPVMAAQSFLTKTNRPVRINPAASDLDSDELTFEIVEPPRVGQVRFENDVFVYTPKPDFIGEDKFKLRPFDGTAYGEPAEVAVSIIATNASPRASGATITAQPNSRTPLTLSGSDPDGDKITFAILNPPLHGLLTGDAPKLFYEPETNYLGPDKFTFRVSDSFDQTEPATVTIQVARQNRPPKAEDQTILVATGEPARIVLNLSDPDGDPLRTIVLRGPAKGILYGSGTNLTYAPRSGGLGPDSFTYKAWDGQKFGNIARVSVTVSLPQSQLPPAFRSLRVLDDAVELTLATPNTNPFMIEASSNLVDWVTVSGELVSSAETFVFKDTNSAAGPASFYRARRK